MSSRTKQILLIALSVLLVVLFLLMPEQPLSVKQNTEVQKEAVSAGNLSLEGQIQSALDKVNGPMPMEGIGELKELLKQNPENVDILYNLGMLSIRSGQYKLAVDRFEKVITFAGQKKYPDTRQKLAMCLEEEGSTEDAITQLEQLKIELEEVNPSAIQSVQDEIERLRNL